MDPGEPKRNFFLRHKLVSAVLAILLLFVVAGIASGGSKPTTTASPTASTAAAASVTSAQPAPASGTADSASAISAQPAPNTAASASADTSYVDQEAHDANVVVVSYQEVQGGVQILKDSGSDPATLAAFQQLLSSAKDGFDTAEHSFVLADAPSGTGTANEEAAAAIREFSDAVAALSAYVDGQKPSDLASFGTHWKQGKAFWNEAVGRLWGAASRIAPTV